MKRKQLAMMLGMVLTVTSLTTGSVFVSAESADSVQQESIVSEESVEVDSDAQSEGEKDAVETEEENTVEGEVTAISETSVTIQGEEELVIPITEDTVFSVKMSGKSGSKPDGDGSGESMEKPDSKPDGEGSGESMEKPDSKPDGEGSGESMEKSDSKPDGDGSGESMEKPDSKPDGEGSGESMEKPDSKPDEEGTGESTGETMEKPEGESGGEMPDSMSENGGGMGGMSMQELSWENIEVGDTITVVLDDEGNAKEIMIEMNISMGQPNGQGMEKPNGESMGQPGGAPGGQSGAPDSYDAATEITEDTTSEGETFASTSADENAVLVSNGASVVIKDAAITRESEDSTGGDDSSFYGIGAAVLTTDGSTYISGSSVESNADGGAGIFSYGDGKIYVADTTISTEEDTSGGIHVAGGGTLYAWDLTIDTQGESSAAIRSDRGSGTMVVDGGTYTSNGSGSPAIYSTADIAVNNAELTANGSEAICIEGLNSIHLFDSNLTGNMSDLSQNDCTWNVILYQSMSGDSEVGNSLFEMYGGTLTANNGGMFYTTNTESTFILDDVDIQYAGDSEFFLKCTGNANERGWGNSGSNGADCLFTTLSQSMEGDVIWDSISTLDLYMTEGSSLTGAVVNDESCAGGGGDGYCNLYISGDSSWVVTADSTVSALYCAGNIQDADGNSVSIVGTDGTVYVEGESEFTITVDSYAQEVDLSGAAATTDWSDYETEKPDELL